MPIPNPGSETREQWMARCVPFLVDNEGKTQAEAVGQCSGLWDQASNNQDGSAIPAGPAGNPGQIIGPPSMNQQSAKAKPKQMPGCPMGSDCPYKGKSLDGPDPANDIGEPNFCPNGSCPMGYGMGNYSEMDPGLTPMTRPKGMRRREVKKINRAYSILTVKSVDEEKRVINGIATTPSPDRLGDIVEPMGVKFKNPMPLLWQHNSDEPVGLATFHKPTEKGIEFTAKLAQPTQSENLIKRVTEAWESVKLGLVKGVSIGFRPVEYSFMDDGGIHFQKSEVMELSLVTIPAQEEATITAIKKFDLDRPKAVLMDSRAVPPAPVTRQYQAIKVGKPKMPQTIAEQISAFESKRSANAARMTTIMQAAADGGRTLEQAESDEYDTLEKEVEGVDSHLVRLRKLETQNRQQLVPVDATAEEKKAGSPQRKVPAQPIKVMPNSNMPDWVPFIRYAICMAAGKGDSYKALKKAEEFGDELPLKQLIEMDVPALLRHDPGMLSKIDKAAIGVGTTTDVAWAGPLIAYTQYAQAFAAVLRPLTIIGRLAGLRYVPFNIQIPVATGGTTMAWVGENAPKPVSNMSFAQIVFRWAKAAGIVVLSDELVRFSNPSAEAIVRDDMLRQMVQFLDRQFIDPSVAAVANVSPASITNGVTPTTATGTNDAAWRADARATINSFLTASYSLEGATWIMTQQQATAFSLMLNALGLPSYPTMSPTGGTLLGFPVIASENLPATGGSPADGYPIILAVPSEILIADDGQTVIDASNQASIQMDSAPDSPPSGTTVLVSLWQMNFTGLRAERWINWGKRRTTAVGYIQNAKYA